jgi:ABC-type branched-subunit amino acid transport system substrate-binding protein
MRTILRATAAGAVLAFAAFGANAQTVKLAFIDPLSGLMAPVGQNQLNSWRYIADLANQKNWAGGPKFEIVPFDNKLSPQESLNALKQVIDQGIRYVLQGTLLCRWMFRSSVTRSAGLASMWRARTSNALGPSKKAYVLAQIERFAPPSNSS